MDIMIKRSVCEIFAETGLLTKATVSVTCSRKRSNYNIRLIFVVSMFILSCGVPKKEESKTQKVQQKNELKKETNTTDSLSGNLARKDKISIKKFTFLSGKLQLEIPSELKPMDSEMYSLKYPSDNMMNTKAYSNTDGTVSLLISRRPETSSQHDLPNYKQMLYETYSKNSSIDFIKCEIEKIGGRDFIVTEMITPAIDINIYNLMLIISLEDKLAIITFNCTVDKVGKWKPVASRIMSSIEVKD